MTKENQSAGVVQGIWKLFLVAAVTVSVCWAVAFVLRVCLVPSDVKWQEAPTIYPIVSLERAAELEGSFILGTGSIGTKMYYLTYKAVGPATNAYLLTKLPAEKTLVIEDGQNALHIRYKMEKYFACGDRWIKIGWDEEAVQYELHVPHGTIKRKMEL